MAKRGTLYRCHLCSFLFGGGGPQSEGIESVWRQRLQPVGEASLYSGQRVELFVTLQPSPIPITIDTPIYFDILEEDVVSDDKVGSILCGPTAPHESFELLDYRLSRLLALVEGESVSEAIARFMSAFPDSYQDYLLIIRDYALYETYYLVTWWDANHQQETFESEFYFIVNVGEQVEDRPEDVLKVKKESAPSQPPLDGAIFGSAFGSRTSIPASLLLAFNVEGPGADQVPEDDESRPDGVPRPVDDDAFREAAAALVAKYPSLVPQSAAGTVDFEIPPPEPPLFAPPAQTSAPLAVLQPPPGKGNTQPTSPSTPASGSVWPYGPHPSGPVSDDTPKEGRSPFDRHTVFLAQPSFLGIFDVRIATRSESTHYVESYDLRRAIQWGYNLFGAGNYVIFEGPLSGPARVRYTVVQLEEPFRFESVTEKDGLIPPTINLSPYHLDLDGLTHVWRLFGDPRSRPPLRVREGLTFAKGMLRDALDEQAARDLSDELDEAMGSNAEEENAFNQRIADTVFKDVEKAIADGKKTRAVELMANLTERAFAVLSAERRKNLALVVIGEIGTFFQNDEANRTLLQIFKSFPEGDAGRLEIEALQKEIGKSDLDRIVRTVYEELTDVLAEVGKRYPEAERVKVDAAFLLAVILDGIGANDPKKVVQLFIGSIAVGCGASLQARGSARELALELLTVARTLLDFLKDFVLGLIQLVRHPVDFVSSIGSLLALLVRTVFAAMPMPRELTVAGLAACIVEYLHLPAAVAVAPTRVYATQDEIARLIEENAPQAFLDWLKQAKAEVGPFWPFLVAEHDRALQELEAMVKSVNEKFENAVLGIRKLGVEKEVVQRYMYRIVWEIAGLFVGAGEIKAVLKGAGAGVRATALMVSKLGNKAEKVAAMERVGRIVDGAGELSKGVKAVDTAAHLPLRDVTAVSDGVSTANHLSQAKTVEQLAHTNPAALVDVVRDAAVETKAAEALQDKLRGRLSKIADAAVDHMRTEGGLTEDQLLKLMQQVPESQADLFSRAVANLPRAEVLGLPGEAMASLYTQLARNPRLAELVARGNEYPRLFAGLVKAKGQSFAEIERLLLQFEEEAGRLAGQDLARLTEDVAAGKIDALETALRDSDGARKYAAQLAALKEPARSEAEKALQFIRDKTGFKDAELAQFFDGVSPERVQKFFDAVNKLPELDKLSWLDQPDMLKGFFRQLQRAPRSLERLANGEVDLFRKLYNSTFGSMPDTERLLAALEHETARLNQAGQSAEAARLLADAVAGKTDDLERVVETLTPRKPPPTAQEIAALRAKAQEALPWQNVMARRAAEAARPAPTTAQWHLRDILRAGEDLYLGMDSKLRDALDTAASRYENLFRDLVTELDDARFAERRAALLKKLEGSGKTKGIATDAMSAMDKVREARVDAVAEAIGGFERGADGKLRVVNGRLVATAERVAAIQQKLPMALFDKALEQCAASMGRRLAEFESVAATASGDALKSARAQAAAIRRQIAALRDWGSTANRATRAQEVAELQRLLEGNLYLGDMLHHGGEQMLMEGAIEMLFGETQRTGKELLKPAKTLAADFAEYMSISQSRFRGNFGEFELAFKLGKSGHVVLKCGDEFVSRTGTDLVTMVHDGSRWRLMIFDNKALRDATVNEVSALVENLLKNLKNDQLKFASIAQRADAPIEFAEASKRLKAVIGDMETIMNKYGGEMTRKAQAEIAQALAGRDVQLLVANAGGQVKGISKPLATMLDFYAVDKGALPPARPLPVTPPATTPAPVTP